MPIRVLYIHPYGVFGGASRSLLEMIRAFPKNSVQPYVITQCGNVEAFLEKMGIPFLKTSGISQFDHTQYGFYRGYRWLLLIREIYYVVFTIYALIKARVRWKDIDIVHINEITMPLAVVCTKLVFRKPVVVHARSVQHKNKVGLRAKVLKRILNKFSDAIIAIDHTVQGSLYDIPNTHVVHNGFTPASDTILPERHTQDAVVIFPKDTFKVAMVGNLHHMKGVYEFVEAARICKGKNVDAKFLIVGGNTRSLGGIKGYLLSTLGFAHDVQEDISSNIRRYSLENDVCLCGFTANVKEIYDNIDVLCFPSHLNAVGRPVFEAAFSKVPSIVAINNPLKDTVIDGQTGLCIEPKNPQALADAIEYFYLRPAEVQRMGALAYELALKNFDAQANARKVLDIYAKLVGT